MFSDRGELNHQASIDLRNSIEFVFLEFLSNDEEGIIQYICQLLSSHLL